MPSDLIFIEGSPISFSSSFYLEGGGVIIDQVRLGQVHCPIIVFLPLLFRYDDNFKFKT